MYSKTALIILVFITVLSFFIPILVYGHIVFTGAAPIVASFSVDFKIIEWRYLVLWPFIFGCFFVTTIILFRYNATKKVLLRMWCSMIMIITVGVIAYFILRHGKYNPIILLTTIGFLYSWYEQERINRS